MCFILLSPFLFFGFLTLLSFFFFFFFFLMILPPPRSTLFPYTTLFRSQPRQGGRHRAGRHQPRHGRSRRDGRVLARQAGDRDQYGNVLVRAAPVRHPGQDLRLGLATRRALSRGDASAARPIPRSAARAPSNSA